MYIFTKYGELFMNGAIEKENLMLLYKAILTLQTEEECKNFFEDLCTFPELKAMSQRIAVANMLKQGYIYSDIVKETSASTATISRVNRSLTYGSDGYNTVLNRLSKSGDNN